MRHLLDAAAAAAASPTPRSAPAAAGTPIAAVAPPPPAAGGLSPGEQAAIAAVCVLGVCSVLVLLAVYLRRLQTARARAELAEQHHKIARQASADSRPVPPSAQAGPAPRQGSFLYSGTSSRAPSLPSILEHPTSSHPLATTTGSATASENTTLARTDASAAAGARRSSSKKAPPEKADARARRDSSGLSSIMAHNQSGSLPAITMARGHSANDACAQLDLVPGPTAAARGRDPPRDSSSLEALPTAAELRATSPPQPQEARAPARPHDAGRARQRAVDYANAAGQSAHSQIRNPAYGEYMPLLQTPHGSEAFPSPLDQSSWRTDFLRAPGSSAPMPQNPRPARLPNVGPRRSVSDRLPGSMPASAQLAHPSGRQAGAERSASQPARAPQHANSSALIELDPRPLSAPLSSFGSGGLGGAAQPASNLSQTSTSTAGTVGTEVELIRPRRGASPTAPAPPYVAPKPPPAPAPRVAERGALPQVMPRAALDALFDAGSPLRTASHESSPQLLRRSHTAPRALGRKPPLHPDSWSRSNGHPTSGSSHAHSSESAHRSRHARSSSAGYGGTEAQSSGEGAAGASHEGRDVVYGYGTTPSLLSSSSYGTRRGSSESRGAVGRKARRAAVYRGLSSSRGISSSSRSVHSHVTQAASMASPPRPPQQSAPAAAAARARANQRWAIVNQPRMEFESSCLSDSLTRSDAPHTAPHDASIGSMAAHTTAHAPSDGLMWPPPAQRVHAYDDDAEEGRATVTFVSSVSADSVSISSSCAAHRGLSSALAVHHNLMGSADGSEMMSSAAAGSATFKLMMSSRRSLPESPRAAAGYAEARPPVCEMAAPPQPPVFDAATPPRPPVIDAAAPPQPPVCDAAVRPPVRFSAAPPASPAERVVREPLAVGQARTGQLPAMDELSGDLYFLPGLPTREVGDTDDGATAEDGAGL